MNNSIVYCMLLVSVRDGLHHTMLARMPYSARVTYVASSAAPTRPQNNGKRSSIQESR